MTDYYSSDELAERRRNSASWDSLVQEFVDSSDKGCLAPTDDEIDSAIEWLETNYPDSIPGDDDWNIMGVADDIYTYICNAFSQTA